MFQQTDSSHRQDVLHPAKSHSSHWLGKCLQPALSFTVKRTLPAPLLGESRPRTNSRSLRSCNMTLPMSEKEDACNSSGPDQKHRGRSGTVWLWTIIRRCAQHGAPRRRRPKKNSARSEFAEAIRGGAAPGTLRRQLIISA